jgi:hypothetical protein
MKVHYSALSGARKCGRSEMNEVGSNLLVPTAVLNPKLLTNYRTARPNNPTTSEVLNVVNAECTYDQRLQNNFMIP